MSNMYPGRKQLQPCPSDAQAREKLALYVYEYLHHIGAKQAAETFLKEVSPFGPQIRWEKNITLGEPPGFLHSWWCVFWDLYCAAPERRESCDHSAEAKAFHDYGFVNSGFPPQVNGIHGPPNATPSPLGMPQPPPDGLPPGQGPPPGHPAFGPMMPGVPIRPSPPQQSSPHSAHGGMPMAGFAGRFPGHRIARMPGDMPFPPGGFPGEQMRPGSQPMMPPQRLPASGPATHVRIQQSPMGPNVTFAQMRHPSPGGLPHPRPGWPPSTSSMHYSEPSPGQFPGGPIMSNGPVPGMGTPTMVNPQSMAPNGLSQGNPAERYMMVSSAASLPPNFPMSSGEAGPEQMMLNGDSLDIKNSPASSQGLNGGTPGPGAGSGGGPSSVPPQSGPRPSSSDSMDYSSSVNPFPSQENEQSEIAKIKQSMMEETKQFESKSGEAGDSEFF